MMITVIHETSSAFNPNLISTLYTRNSRTSFAPFCIGQAPREFLNRRRRLQIKASSLVFPLLPFPIEQVLVPSEAKTIHLYETRYISLLEESLYRKSKLFVHVVLDPIGIGGASADASFATRYGCLVMIEKVEQLEVGALVSIRGVGRVKTLDLKQVQPYLTGEVAPLQDSALQEMKELSSKVLELRETLHSLNSLEIKLKTPEEASLQTRTMNSLLSAEKEQSLDFATDFVPSVAERISFAALQLVSGATQSDLLKLQREKLKAMDVMDTFERLELSLQLARYNIANVAAKLAIQSLELR